MRYFSYCFYFCIIYVLIFCGYSVVGGYLGDDDCFFVVIVGGVNYWGVGVFGGVFGGG